METYLPTLEAPEAVALSHSPLKADSLLDTVISSGNISIT